MQEYLSLYDYLGRAAGLKLGARVKDYAVNQGAAIRTREVSNPKYKGPVNLYTEGLLDAFFNNPNHRDIITEDKTYYESKRKKSLERKVSESQDNTLPF